MKNVITYLKALWRRGLGSQSSDVSLDCRLTVGSPSVKCGSTLMRLVSVMAILLTVGVGNVWGAAKTVKYNVSTYSSVTVDATIDDKPDGSSATFSNTYTSNKDQMTGGNYQTLTLSDFGEVAVVNLTLSMHSNSGSGAGVIKYSTDGGSTWTYLVGSWDSENSRESGVAFSNKAFGNGYSTSFKDVSFTAPIVTQSSKNLVIRIHSTENSIFCQSYQLTYTTEQYTLTYNAGSGSCETPSEKQGSIGAALTLPSASPNSDCAAKGWSFAGWAESSCTETGTKPTLYAAGSSYIPSEDKTFYAVYKVGSTYTIDFESAASAYTDWTFTNITSKQENDNVTAHGGSYIGLTANTNSYQTIVTNATLETPQFITFYISKTTTNTGESYWKVYVSEDGSDWGTAIKSQDAKSMGKGGWVEVTQDLSEYSNVYVKVEYGTNNAIRVIDDLELSCVIYNSNPDCTYDWFIDIMHDNTTIEKQGASYSMPAALSDESKGSYCEGEHYHFLGWVDADYINENGTLKAGATLYPAGHSGHTAANKTFYAIWGKEE